MKLAIFFRRPARPRAATRKPDYVRPDWTIRDWADLPPHHPPRD